jgi:hypothetical protein
MHYSTLNAAHLVCAEWFTGVGHLLNNNNGAERSTAPCGLAISTDGNAERPEQ